MRKYALYFAWLLSLIGTLFSLYLSEILHWPICVLCWYQRICLYPLVILLGMACFYNDNRMAIYALPLTLLGIVLAGYQYLEQMIPGFSPIDVCGAGPSCSHIDAIWFDFITLPLLSLGGFMVISALLITCLRKNCEPGKVLTDQSSLSQQKRISQPEDNGSKNKYRKR